MVKSIYLLILFRQVEKARLLHSENDTENKGKEVQTRLQHPWRSSGRSKIGVVCTPFIMLYFGSIEMDCALP